VPMHRIDTDTSGCLLFARNPSARKIFQQAFETRRVRKEYLAVLDGVPLKAEGTIGLALAKISSREEGWRMVPDASGKPAETQWRMLGEKDGKALVQFIPLTGRTHQLRVHAAHGLNAPILGDPVYGGGAKGARMMLHASRIVMPRGAKEAIDVTAPLPDAFAAFEELARLDA
jgi:tRNA pseudouridine32 synthase/23S rRNA pseudouridine746 synthase